MARRGHRGTLALAGAATALTLLLSGCGGAGDTGAPVTGITTNDDDGYRGIGMGQDAYRVPEVAGLTDTEGRPFDLATQDERTLVFFGYTKCPDICQVVMSTIASAVAKLSPEDKARLQMVFVTTDPARTRGRCCAPTSTATTPPSRA